MFTAVNLIAISSLTRQPVVAVMIRNSCPFNFSKNAIEERIKAIMATKKVTRLSMLVSFVNYPQADRKFQHKKRPDCYIKPLLLGYFCFMSK